MGMSLDSHGSPDARHNTDQNVEKHHGGITSVVITNSILNPRQIFCIKIPI